MKLSSQVLLIFCLFIISLPVFSQSKQSNQLSTSASAIVKGKLIFRELEYLKSVTVRDGILDKDITVDSGNNFQFEIPEDSPYEYSLTSDKDFLFEVNVGDIIAIYNHINQKKIITEPLNLIAADINESGTITVQDIIELRKLILGKTEKFTSGASWRFIDATFPLFTNNWNLANEKVTASADNSFYNEFYVVKLGNPEGFPFFNNPIAQCKSEGPTGYFTSQQNPFGRSIDLSFPATDIAGLQLDVVLDPSVRFVRANSSLSDLTYRLSPDGRHLTILLTAEDIELIKGQSAFSFESDNATIALHDLIALNDSGVNLVVSGDRTYGLPVFVEKDAVNTVTTTCPSVFSNDTKIAFKSAQDDKVQLTVFDINGRPVFQKSIFATSGENYLPIDKNDLKGKPGTYFYQLSGEKITGYGKMIMLD